jgi:hypothetical protein
MTLEAVYEDKAKIPEGLAAHYVETDGVFVLDAPGMKTQKDFDAYADALKKRFTDAGADFARKNGAGLSRDDVLEVVEGALKKFAPKGGTPPKSDGAGAGSGVSDEIATKLHDLERNVASLTEQNERIQKERDVALNSSRDTTIKNSLTEAAAAAGVAPEGVGNLVSLVKQNFEITQDGSVVTKLDAGAGVSPNTPPADFFSTIARDKSFRMFWPKSVGAGADGAGAGGAGAGGDLGKGNPWSKAGWNMTQQGKQFQANRKEAERLMEVAGVTLGATAPVR